MRKLECKKLYAQHKSSALIVRDKEIFSVDENSQVLSQIKIRYVAIGENNLTLDSFFLCHKIK